MRPLRSPSPPVVTSGPIVAHPVRQRSSREFATRNCVHCNGELTGDDGSVKCPSCGKRSEVALCQHGAPLPTWRITRWHESDVPHAKRRRDIVAVTVGDHTVYLGRFRDSLSLRAEDGARLPLQKVKAVEAGAEVIERMVHIGSCYRCACAFFLPDCEIKASGPPRILRANVEQPTRTYMRPVPDPVRLSAAYLALGTDPPEAEP
jgi:hypothetical protein